MHSNLIISFLSYEYFLEFANKPLVWFNYPISNLTCSSFSTECEQFF